MLPCGIISLFSKRSHIFQHLNSVEKRGCGRLLRTRPNHVNKPYICQFETIVAAIAPVRRSLKVKRQFGLTWSKGGHGFHTGQARPSPDINTTACGRPQHGTRISKPMPCLMYIMYTCKAVSSTSAHRCLWSAVPKSKSSIY